MTAVSRRAAGVIILRDTADGVRFLLLRAYRNWDFPKGMVEPGEELLAAAFREAREETGIDDLELRWGEQYIETAPYSGNKIARYYLAHTDTERVVLHVNPALGRPEHNEWRWVGLAEATALLPVRLQPVIAWAATKLEEAHSAGT